MKSRVYPHFLGAAFFSFLMIGLVEPVTGFAASLAPYSSRLWQTEDGLPKNSVRAIAQTTDGYLWFAAQDELVRFDGVQFETVPMPPIRPRETQWISDLWATRDGALWIGSEDGSVVRYEGKKFTLFPYDGYATNLVLVVYEDRNKSIWVGTRDGLFHWDGHDFSPVVIGKITKKTSVRSITEDLQGNLWFGFTGGVQCMRDGMVVTNYTSKNGLQNDFVRTVCCDRRGVIWIGSNNGITRLENGQFQHFGEAQGLPDPTIKQIFEDSRGNVWAGTFGGLARWNEGNFVVEQNHEGDVFLSVNCFYEDHEGNLWMGTKEGLHRLNPRQFSAWTMRQGLAHNNVICVFEDSATNLWLGTWGGGLQRFKDGIWTTFAAPTTKPMANNLILSLCERRDGTLWFGTDYNGGLYQMTTNGEVKRFTQKEGLPGTALRSLYEDVQGEFWVGSSGGLFRWNGKKFVKTNSVTNEVVRCFAEDRQNRLWIGTETGIFILQDGTFRWVGKENGLSSEFVYTLYADREGSVWIGTSRGLNRCKDNKFVSWQTQQGLPGGPILEVLEDDSGFLWLATRSGIIRVSKRALEDCASGKLSKVVTARFDQSDGLASSVCVGTARPSGWRTKDGRLWFATTKGVAVTDPGLRVERNEKPPAVVIQRMIADKKNVAGDGWQASKSDANQVTAPSAFISIQPGRREIEFHYAALSFRTAEKNRYKYKLEGVDPDWVDAGTRRVAYYNNLPPGDYEFRVMGSNNDGVWNVAPANIRFSLLPYFWETWWFRTSEVVAAILLVAGTARFITKKRMQLKLERIEQQHAVEKERLRIAQDMHDEVGAKLTKITFLGGLAKNRMSRPEDAEKQVDNMLHTARDLIGALDEIVWAVDPRNDTLDNFANYLCRHASEFFENSPIACELNVPGDVPHHPLTADVRHNLFLAIKETLNNALKHSGATKVIVQLTVRSDEFEIVISDNGRGFPQTAAAVAQSPPKTKRKGNGLGNMRQRLESIGGRCDMQSVEGQGTRISFVVPL